MGKNAILTAASVVAVASIFGGGNAYAQGAPNTLAQGALKTEEPAPAKVAYAMGDIGRAVTYGSGDEWKTSATDDGSLVLASVNDHPGWLVDKHVGPNPPYTVEARVRSQIPPVAGHAVGGGLVVAYQDEKGSQPRSFYTAYIAGDTVFLTSYGKDGFNILWQGKGVGASCDGFTKLRITVKSQELTVVAEGSNTLSTTQSADRPLSGGYGVFVSGAGQAAFRDLYLH